MIAIVERVAIICLGSQQLKRFCARDILAYNFQRLYERGQKMSYLPGFYEENACVSCSNVSYYRRRSFRKMGHYFYDTL